MDGLELNVRQRCLDEQPHVEKVVAEKSLKCTHAFGDVLGRRRDEHGIGGARTADPVLAGAERTWMFVAAAAARKQRFMDLSNEAE